EAHHRCKISDDALFAAASLADRYIQDRHLPDKAIDLIDEAGSRMRIRTMSAPPRYRELEEEIEKVRKDKEDAIENQEFEKAASLRDKERKLSQTKRELEENWRQNEAEAEQPEVGEEEIADIVSMWTGIPVFKLTEAETAKLMRMEEELHKRVIGQHQAVEVISKAIRRSRAGLKDPKRPTGSFVFLGPSGVGKTELARTLAEFLFGDEDAMVRIDMSEYMEKHAVSRLVGSPPGYVGYDQGGLLTDAVDQHPHSVLLLDEIEKAHPDLFNILLQVMDNGKLTDHHGKTVDFRNTILIMTTNAGASDMARESIGFGAASREDAQEDAVKKMFSPEFRNRLDAIVPFSYLPPAVVARVVDKFILQLELQLADRNVHIELDDEAREWIVVRGYDKLYGARPMGRLVQEKIKQPLAEELLFGKLVNGGEVRVRIKDNAPAFEIVPAPPKAAKGKAAAKAAKPKADAKPAAKRKAGATEAE
ncbi:MAG: AAA family ATPase, partial [Sphingomicrobium sp.]